MRLPSSVLSLLAGTVATASLGAMGCGGAAAAATENRTTPTVVASAPTVPPSSTTSLQPTGNTNATHMSNVVTPDMDIAVGCGRG
jgi:hypothetical protein